jgi:hypothetical protein
LTSVVFLEKIAQEKNVNKRREVLAISDVSALTGSIVFTRFHSSGREICYLIQDKIDNEQIFTQRLFKNSRKSFRVEGLTIVVCMCRHVGGAKIVGGDLAV